jgi:hypothetical protein
VGSGSGGTVRGDANPDGDRTDDRVLSLALFIVLALFIILDIFVLDDLLETNDVDCCKTNLEILVSKLYKDSKHNNNSDDDSNDNDDNIDFNEPDERP